MTFASAIVALTGFCSTVLSKLSSAREGGRLFRTYFNQCPVSRDLLLEIAEKFHGWMKNRSEKWMCPVP